ncbi:MAG: hypothetical protein ACR2QC_02360 [Gammaproteobacteria bacterium]
MKKEKLSKAITGNFGLFYVCCELSRRGFIATPTARNTEAIDLFVAKPGFAKSLTVQVKSRLSHVGEDLAEKGKNVVDPDLAVTRERAEEEAKRADFWVFVYCSMDGDKISASTPEVFVCRGDDKGRVRLIECHSSECGFYPYRKTTKRKGGKDRTKIHEKWQKQKGDAGWKLITDALNAS